MYYVPWIGQQTLLTDVLGNKPISPLVFVVVGVVNVALAVVVVRGDAGTAAPGEDYLRKVDAIRSHEVSKSRVSSDETILNFD